MSAFTIKDLENLSGIKAHTIRMWEQRYNFLKPQRSCTNIRYYTNDDLKTLLNVALLNKFGYKISHIDRMRSDEICATILSLKEAAALQERYVNELVREMIDMETDKFESIINKYIELNGIERTINEIIFPFLEKIGILWQTGHIVPAQEHFVSNIVRQKLIVAIDGLKCVRTGKPCLLFLPEGEHHELGLLFLHYLLKAQEKKVIYLGTNVPMKDVESIVMTMKPELAFIHLTGAMSNPTLEKLLNAIKQRMPELPTIISGHPTHHYLKDLPPGITFKKSLPEIIEFIETI